MENYDVLVIGGGISGVSIAYEAAEDRQVGLLEMESSLAYHTSGRSLATFLETYGPLEIRALTTGSRSFFEDPQGLVETPLLSPLGLLQVAGHGQAQSIRDLYDEVTQLAPSARLVTGDEAVELNPALRPGFFELGLYDAAATEIDVNALHAGYVRGLKQRRGEVHKSSKVVGAVRDGGRWIVTDARGNTYSAATVVNAAGSWVDEVASVFGARPIGIEPKRRSVFIVTPPDGVVARGLPLTGNLPTSWYFMPQGDAIAASPAEENLHEPADAKPDELEMARAIEELNEATCLSIRSIKSPWAGLRNFIPDGNPAVGFDSDVEGFFWYAAQGGYGMQVAPALSKAGAALLRPDPELSPIAQDLRDRGITLDELSPGRPAIAQRQTH